MLTTNKKRILLSASLLCGGGLSYYYHSINPTDQRHMKSFLSSGVRFFRSFSIGTVIALDYRWTSWWHKNQESETAAWHACHQRSAERLLRGCLLNGGIYVKLGQGLVAMNHILPAEYIRTLEVLHNQAITRPFAEIEQIFKEDFNGATTGQLFQHFEKEPFAAASLAQVHRATTITGESVAVKVQYIDLRERFHWDMTTLQGLLSLVGHINPDFGFAWVLDEMRETLLQELDFEAEGRNAERCGRDLSIFRDRVVVPRVIWPLSSKRVLTAQYFGDACKLNDVDAIQYKLGLRLRDVDETLVAVFAHQIFHTGFVHADPHPGNVLVTRRPNNTSLLWRMLRPWRWRESPVQLVILDHGLYEWMPVEQRTELSLLFRAILHLNETEMQQRAHNLGVNDWKTFAEIILLRPLHTHKYKLGAKLSEADRKYMRAMAAQRFDEIMRVLREMPKPMLLFIRNMNTIRSICHHHGGVVNRYLILGDKAIESSAEALYGGNSILLWLNRWWMKWQLYSVLKWHSVGEVLWRKWLAALHFIGRAPSVQVVETMIREAENVAIQAQPIMP